MMKNVIRMMFLAVIVADLGSTASAVTITHGGTTIDMDFVTVGNAGNAADTTGDPNPCGSVAYEYRIGKYDYDTQKHQIIPFEPQWSAHAADLTKTCS